MVDRIEKIAERCSNAGLKTKSYIYKEKNPDEKITEIPGLIVQIPEERQSKNIIILEDDELEQIEKSSFEKFKFIKGFEAIWSPEQGIVEGELQSDDLIRGGRILMRRLIRFFETSDGDQTKSENSLIDIEDYKFHFPSPNQDINIIIGYSSLEFSILNSFQREYLFITGRIRQRPTIRIEGLSIKTHDEAKSLLSKIANSIFFQIDLATNIPLHLAVDRELFRDIRLRRKVSKENFKFSPPKYEYDQEPMSLYWYARTAANMPLLQFLAFYQVLEFYFPQYSYMEAQREIKNLLKNPTFDANKDSDVAKILNLIKITSKGKSYGNEKDQLKVTILNIIDKTSIHDYLKENEDRTNFFDIRNKSKSLAKHKISFTNSDHDIRTDVALRIYEIRCRIVHTKDEDELELLLPYSPEIRNLKHDLELVEFLARKVIIAGGRQIKLNI